MKDMKNFGIYEGRLYKDPVFFQNANGSETVILAVARKRSFGEESDFIEFHGFNGKDVKNHGVYGYLQTGDKVTIQFSLRSGRSEKSDGTTAYYQSLLIEDLDIAESKDVREARRAAQKA